MQSRRMSLIESLTQTVIGYLLAVVTQIIILPWFGLDLAVSQSFVMAAIFTGISLCRSYAIRRVFNGTRRLRTH